MIEDILNIDNISYKDLEFDIIYHLEGLARIQPSFINPVKYFHMYLVVLFPILNFLIQIFLLHHYLV